MSSYIKTTLLFFFMLMAILVEFACMRQQPTAPEGLARVIVYVEFEGNPVDSALVEISLIHDSEHQSQYTDEQGMAIFDSLISATYNIIAQAQPETLNVPLVGTTQIVLQSPKTSNVSIPLQINNPGLKINEIYYAGSTWSEGKYRWDQFIELYNASEDTLYLDGMIIVSLFPGNKTSVGRDMDGDGDIDLPERGVLVYQFPGVPLTGREYPVWPYTFVVLARSATNHPTDIDLSRAHWEFYNPDSDRDVDNPEVPNICNIRKGSTDDCELNFSSAILLLCSGADVVYEDGIDISSIIDGVEYQREESWYKTLEPVIDCGFAGVGLSIYSGQSIERKYPGLDSNNSSIDFHNLSNPTPECP